MLSRRLLQKIERNAAELIQAGILMPDAREKIAGFRKHFPGAAEIPASRILRWLLRALMLFLFLCGAILLACCHWDEYTPGFRILLGAMPLLPAAIFAFMTLPKRNVFLRELGGTLLALAFAGALAVVRSNTQMDWNASDIMRETALMTLLLVWMCDSLFLSGMLTGEILVLLFWETELFPALYFPAALAPFLLIKLISCREKAPLFSQFAGALLLLLFSGILLDFRLKDGGIDTPTLLTALTALLLLAAAAAPRAWKKYNVFSVTGKAAFILCLSLAGFRFFWADYSPWHFPEKSRMLTAGIFAGLSLLFLLLLILSIRNAREKRSSWAEIAFAIALLFLPPASGFHPLAGPVAALILLCVYVICLLQSGLKNSSVAALWAGTAILEGQILLHFFIPEAIPRKTMGWIFLASSFLLAVLLLGTKNFFPKRETDPAEEKK